MASDCLPLLRDCIKSTFDSSTTASRAKSSVFSLLCFGRKLDEFSEFYLPGSGHWKEMETIAGFGKATVRNGVPFFVGGGAAGNEVKEFNFTSWKTSECPPLQTGRSDHAIAIFSDAIYAVGGISNGSAITSVERLSHESILSASKISSFTGCCNRPRRGK